jgi:hypothetical protein
METQFPFPHPICGFFQVASFIGSGINGNLFWFMALLTETNVASFIGSGINGNANVNKHF